MVPAGTGLRGFEERRSYGVSNYGEVLYRRHAVLPRITVVQTVRNAARIPEDFRIADDRANGVFHSTSSSCRIRSTAAEYLGHPPLEVLGAVLRSAQGNTEYPGVCGKESGTRRPQDRAFEFLGMGGRGIRGRGDTQLSFPLFFFPRRRRMRSAAVYSAPWHRDR